MKQRCTRCGRYGHPTEHHDVFAAIGKSPALWYVAAYDVAGGLRSWYGPLHWAAACAVARCVETDETVRATRVGRRDATMHGASWPIPDGWRDFLPTRAARSPRVHRTHHKHVNAPRRAA